MPEITKHWASARYQTVFVNSIFCCWPKTNIIIWAAGNNPTSIETDVLQIIFTISENCINQKIVFYNKPQIEQLVYDDLAHKS